MITSKEYVKQGGVVCPNCGSHDICGESIEVNSGGAFQTISCNDCEAVWVDNYKLTGYSELDIPAKEDKA